MSKRVTVIVEGREYIVEVGDLSESPIKATVNQRTYQVEVPRQSTQSTGPDAPVAAPVPTSVRATQSAPAPASSAIRAPMPGNVVEVKVKVGDSVQSQDVICVLDAMKMNNMIYADRPGVIATVDVVAGQAVDYGAVLVTFR
jgi:biotin carboxyl carrier protein